jgi:glyceraldehyde 3-phosphate dehydrogenase
MHAHLLEFDTVHGRWDAAFAHDADSVTHRRHAPALHRHARSVRPAARRGGRGHRLHRRLQDGGRARALFRGGRQEGRGQRPVKDGDAANIVYGVNDDIYDPARHRIVTAASCTTNCLAPVVKVVHENLGIRHGSITTIHDVTNTQTIVDRPAKDLRRARSALNSLIPTTTGSATAITLIYPELKGRLNGHAVRVPLLNASLTDCVFELERATTVEEVNALFKPRRPGRSRASSATKRGLSCRPTTPTTPGPHRRWPSTMVVNGTQLKVYAWYDNEMGYAHRLVDVALMVGASV